MTFINPGISDINDPTGGFWLSVSAFMQAAAEDLGVDLEIIYSERNRIFMRQQAEEVAKRKTPPDYLVVVNEKQSADAMVMAADRAGIKVFVMMNVFVDDQAKKMGRPRDKYENWIGTLVPDNHFAGYTIGKILIDTAVAETESGANETIHMLAVAGDKATQASVERVDGLNQAVAEYPNIVLSQVLYGKWSRDNAYDIVRGGLLRYPETRVIWAANDPMALGALDAVKEKGNIPGKNIFIGGLNWDAPGLEKVKSKEITTSVGGHFMTGGWAVVLLHDYHRGMDFANPDPELKFKIFSPITAQNVDSFLEKFGDRNWRAIDFTRFSKVTNPDLGDYRFDLDMILSQ